MSMKKKYLIFWAGMILIGLFFVWIRMPMLTIENSLKGWNSDYAIFVMMGEDIWNGVDFPFFYWGGNYLGPLNGFFMGATQRVMEVFGYAQSTSVDPNVTFSIGPLAASITCLWMFLAGTLFYGLAFLRLFTVWETLLACLALSVGGESFIRFSLRPLAPEVAYFLAGIITWKGITLIQNPNKKNQFLFGFIFGFCWWMNQMTIFALAPIFYFFISQSEYYKSLRLNFQFKERLFLNMKALDLPPLNRALKAFLLFAYSLVGLNFILGAYIAIIGGINERPFGIKLKIHNGFSPMKTSLLIFLGTQFFIWFFKNIDSKKVLKNIASTLRYFLSGVFLGYGPVLLGKVLGLYEKGYKPAFKFVPLEHIPTYWKNLAVDFFPRLLGEPTWYFSLPLFAVLILTCIIHTRKNSDSFKNYFFAKPVAPSIHSVLWGVVLFNLFYLLFCERVRENYNDRTAFRYALLSLPIIAIYITTLVRRIPFKKLGITLTIIAFVSLSFGQYVQGQNYLIKMELQSTHSDELEQIMSSPCEIFFNGYWETYLYEYLLQHQKRFAVIESQSGQDRTRNHTQLMKNSDKKKCEGLKPIN
jgi:hypothetical protein